MSIFYLIRHGMNDWVGKRLAGWLPGVHLNAEGRAQAERTAGELARAGLSALYTSPLDRARETAEIIAARLGLAPEAREAFGEFRVGEWEGRDIDGLAADARWRAFNSYRSGTRPPGGELMGEVQVRFVAELERLRTRHPGAHVAVVSHADPIKAAIAHYLGIPLDLCLRLEIHPASVSMIRVEDWGAQILVVNGLGAAAE